MVIDQNLIVLNLKSNRKEEVIKELAELAFAEGKITSVNDYVQTVLDREKLFTTGVGNGIAIPHGKTDSVKESMMVFAKLNQQIEWESLDGKPVDLVFLLGVPEKDANDLHLQILSRISRKLMDDTFVDKLRRSQTKDEVMDILNSI
ncbi:MAG: putative IIA-like nitrogen-regulatory protein PtsN [Caloramator sp.]|jgi:PTS system fructose-specific IIA component|uniref:PTS sugar transporter subunit IIA n=1 Tax=Caloramator sp. TaxID=1871330 RepID=UPI001E0A9C28|nr:PTS sugar transporter subunit IIA [Caloramator sp.]MBZ4662730.1 putative IIA-like nitrogen-regulatory protein PtsN [Caloramator sp.]